ncbi:MAG: sugar transferase [Bacteroidota bacterium]|nr:sugar transferase [Bacteroidota bacterium]
MREKKHRLKYILLDLFSAILAWGTFNAYREIYFSESQFKCTFYYFTKTEFWIALFILPFLWVSLYYLFGHYREIWRRSLLIEFWQTMLASLIGSTVMFFGLLLDDNVLSYKDYYYVFVALFLIHFVTTWFFRYLFTSYTLHQINRGKIGFKTLLLGNNSKASQLYHTLNKQDETYGYDFVGYVSLSGEPDIELDKDLKFLGALHKLQEIIREHRIQEIIIAIESSDHEVINSVLMQLRQQDVIIKAIPSLSEMLSGRVRLSFFLGEPLVVVNHDLMKPWQKNFKRIFDIIFSFTGLVLLSPFIIFIILGIKLTSKGPVFYLQERIGKNEQPFLIFKFRSMYVDAEKEGPQLSCGNDPRITRFGRFMRKNRIDELPQFINVLKGDMSVVGPRPERKFYIKKIMEKAPYYTMLLTVRPGITSWGAVKYGYTENVEQMFEQLKFDIYYVRNMSLLLDFKILFKTISVVLNGSGK